MNIVLISTGEYPDQHAAAIRHSTIAQGFRENGHIVNFLLLSPQAWNTEEQVYKGVSFKTFNNYKGAYRFLKIFHSFRAISKVKRSIESLNQKSKIDGIVIFSIDVVVIKSLLAFAKKKNIKVFHERTELPYVIGRQHTISGNLKFNFYLNKLIPKFDGIFVISDKLKDYFRQYNVNVEKILTVVDSKFFNTRSNRPFEFRYIAYCGTMRGTKDGVPILIESFAKLSEKFRDHRLILIGNDKDKNAIQETIQAIEKFRIKEKVIFTGLVDRAEMPGLLGHADLLVVSKPDNEQNSGNFPIKIGEYLATGIPLVVTSVGEIPKFITDGQTGFLAEPNSAESFFLKMNEALSNYEKAKQIGQRGKMIAQNVFDYRIQAKRMADYIKNQNK